MNQADIDEYQQLKAEREATLKAQKIANDLSDEYQTLVMDLEKERNTLLQQQIESAEVTGDEKVRSLFEQLRDARMSCSRRNQSQHNLERELNAARMSCARNRDTVIALRNESDLLHSLSDESPEVASLKSEIVSLREEVQWNKQQADKAWETASQKDQKISSLESQCNILQLQLADSVTHDASKMETVKSAANQIAEVVNTARNSLPPSNHSQQLADLHQKLQLAEEQLGMLRTQADDQTKKLSEKLDKIGEYENLLTASRASVSKRDEIVREQVQKLEDYQKQLVEFSENKVGAEQKLVELESEIGKREQRIAQLAARAEQAEVAVKQAKLFENQQPKNHPKPSGSKRTTPSNIPRDTRKKNTKAPANNNEPNSIEILRQRCERAEEEARNFFLAGEAAAEAEVKLIASRLSCSRHLQNEDSLRTELATVLEKQQAYEQKVTESEQLRRQLEDEHREYCETLQRQLKKERTQADDEIAILQNEIRILGEEKKALREELVTVKVANAEGQEEIQQASKKIEQLMAAESQAPTAQLESELASVRLSNAKHRNEQQANHATVEELTMLAEDRTNELDFLVAEVETKEEEIEFLKQQAEEFYHTEEQLVQLNEVLKRKEDEKFELEAEVASRDMEVAEMMTSISNLEEKIAESASVYDELKNSQTIIARLEKKIKRESAQSNNLKHEIKELKNRLKSAEENSHELDSYKHRVETLTDQLQTLANSNKQNEGETERMRSIAVHQKEELARAKRRDGREDVLKRKLEKVIEAYGKMKQKYQHEKEKNAIKHYREQENSPSPVVPMEMAIDADYRCVPQAPPLMSTEFKLDSPPKMTTLAARSDNYDDISFAGRSYREDASSFLAKESRRPKNVRKGRFSLQI
eukprot:TRINITY_DN1060_c0_g1_i1.p1 TRINITY_DN1060_c0_g1~~TRINITY_DN1060_c0_g1_i1.p1  ORF type:complete len:878 (+),score=272.21 TRINITY_DN1060_c0_g1_i1:40-2673(+)